MRTTRIDSERTSGARSHALRRTTLLCIALGVVLTGCDARLNEIDVWMDDTRASARPIKVKLEEPKRFEPFYYELVEEIQPFSPLKLASLQDPMQVRAKGGLAPDVSRRREILENFPIEQIQMVGFMRSKRHDTALLQVDKTIYQARVGGYAGQNFGLITNIGETEVALRELVQDATGDWVERETVLKLQESGK